MGGSPHRSNVPFHEEFAVSARMLRATLRIYFGNLPQRMEDMQCKYTSKIGVHLVNDGR